MWKQMADKEIHTIKDSLGVNHVVGSHALSEISNVKKNEASPARHFSVMPNLTNNYEIDYSIYSEAPIIDSEISEGGSVTSNEAVDINYYSKLCFCCHSKPSWDIDYEKDWFVNFSETSIIPISFLSSVPQKVVLIIGMMGGAIPTGWSRYEFNLSMTSDNKLKVEFLSAPQANNDYRIVHMEVWGMR